MVPEITVTYNMLGARADYSHPWRQRDAKDVVSGQADRLDSRTCAVAQTAAIR